MTRIDKYLWFVRLFKTRAKASEACGKGRVMVENTPVKASRAVVIGDTIQIKCPPVVYTFRVLGVYTVSNASHTGIHRCAAHLP